MSELIATAASINNNKRLREEDEEQHNNNKLLRVESGGDLPDAELLFGILDCDSDSDQIQDLEDVMKSLEDEISLTLPDPGTGNTDPDPLGFLLEASDDELGLPPSVSDPDPITEVDPEPEEVSGFEKIWGDEIHLDFGFGFESGFGFDCGESGFEDLTWQRTEFLPAV